MPRRITYYLGAGASANAVPVVAKLSEALSTWKTIHIPSYVSQFGNLPFESQYGNTVADALEALKKEFQWLCDESARFFTIDSLAKKYSLTRKHSELRRLKAVLSVFLMLEQIRQPVDPRYDAFWAAVVDDSLNDFKEKSGINIISWNYDYQIEKSLSRFFDLRSYALLKENLQLLDTTHDFSTEPPDMDKSKFSLIKVNGSAEMFKTTNEVRNIEYFWHHDEISADRLKNIIQIFNAYNSSVGEALPLLTFAWEKSLISKYVRKQAQLVTENTEILIVIGYSFPFFNRQIDREILTSMKSLKHAYIQATPAANGVVKERFLSFLPKFSEITLIDDISQFYIPYEY